MKFRFNLYCDRLTFTSEIINVCRLLGVCSVHPRPTIIKIRDDAIVRQANFTILLETTRKVVLIYDRL